MSTPVQTKQGETVSRQFAKLTDETNEAAQDMKDFVFVQKTQFIEKMQCQLIDIRNDLDRLSVRIGASSDASKAEAELKLQLLRDQAEKLNKQLDDVKGATESTWSEIKGRFDKVYLETMDCIQHSRKWLSDKIAP